MRGTRTERTQAIIDAFYAKTGPCCAGCDWWRWHNVLVGECTRTAPVSGMDRISMLGITGTSAPIPSGHIMTPREHVCGEFKDEPTKDQSDRKRG